MSTIKATWQNGQIIPDGPVDWPEGCRLEVREEQPVATGEQGQRMAAALEQLAALGEIAEIHDAAAWERAARQDRPLPGRDE